MEAAIGCLGIILFLALGLAQMVLGYLGVEYLIATWAAWVALGLALFMRIMLPLTIGTYFGAVEVLGWPWWGGVLITAPGLIFIIPGIISAVFSDVRSRGNG